MLSRPQAKGMWYIYSGIYIVVYIYIYIVSKHNINKNHHIFGSLLFLYGRICQPKILYKEQIYSVPISRCYRTTTGRLSIRVL